MGKIEKEHIDKIREYLLSFDEGIRNNIRSNISATLLKYITIIESGFIKDGKIDRISREIDALESIEDLQKLRNEYFITLAQISIDNEINIELDRIKSWNNQSFQKLLNEIADDKSFEKDTSLAIKLRQREDMKKRFQKLDEEDEFEISDKEIKSVITQVERESMKKQFTKLDYTNDRNIVIKLITRYSIAVAIIGLIFGGSYFIMFSSKYDRNYSHSSKDSIIKNNQSIANLGLPYIIEKRQEKKILILATSRGIIDLIKDSINIEVNGLSNQIDTLQSIFKNLQNKDEIQRNSIQYQLIKQIDSLQGLINTYTFDSIRGTIVLNIPKIMKVESVICFRLNNLSKFYIKINDKYYPIEANIKPVEMIPIKDKSLKDSLETLETF